jgi:hypothetical protein
MEAEYILVGVPCVRQIDKRGVREISTGSKGLDAVCQNDVTREH